MKILCINLCAQGCLFTQFTLLEVQSLGSNVITFGNPDTHILPTSFLKVATAGYILIIWCVCRFLEGEQQFSSASGHAWCRGSENYLALRAKTIWPEPILPYLGGKKGEALFFMGNLRLPLHDLQVGGKGPGLPKTHWTTGNQLLLGWKVVSGTRWRNDGSPSWNIGTWNNGTFLWPLNKMRSGHLNSGGKMIRMDAKGSRKQDAKWRQGGLLRTVQVEGACLLYSMPLWTVGGCSVNNFTI